MNRHGSTAPLSASEHRADRSVLNRLTWLLGLGAVELLGLSLWLDSESVAATGLFRLILKKFPDGLLLAVVALLLSFLIGGFLGWQSLRREIERRNFTTGFPWIGYGAHLVLLAAFAVTSFWMVNQTVEAPVDPETVTLIWIATAIAAGASWWACLLPWPLWKPAIVAGRGGLFAAIPITLSAWLAGRATRALWDRLSEPTLSGVVWLLRACGEQPEWQAGSDRLTLRDFTVAIDPHCSGLEGVGAMAVFSAVFVWVTRAGLRWPQAALLVPLAMAASWCGNLLRIALLVEIGAKVSPEVARGGFHSQAGWMFLIAISTLVVGAARRLRFFNRDVRTAVRLRESAVAACLVPFLAWNIIGIISTLFSPDPAFDHYYPARLLAVLIPGWYWRSVYVRLLTAAAGRWFALGSGVAAGALAFGVWMVLDLWLQPDAGTLEAEVQSWPAPWSQLWLASRIAGSCLAIPLVEELAFRGYMLRRLKSFRFDAVAFSEVGWPAILVTSLAFGALHGERWIAGLIVGVMYALAARYANCLAAAVLAHATTNSLLTIYVLLTGESSRWH